MGLETDGTTGTTGTKEQLKQKEQLMVEQQEQQKELQIHIGHKDGSTQGTTERLEQKVQLEQQERLEQKVQLEQQERLEQKDNWNTITWNIKLGQKVRLRQMCNCNRSYYWNLKQTYKLLKGPGAQGAAKDGAKRTPSYSNNGGGGHK